MLLQLASDYRSDYAHRATLRTMNHAQQSSWTPKACDSARSGLILQHQMQLLMHARILYRSLSRQALTPATADSTGSATAGCFAPEHVPQEVELPSACTMRLACLDARELLACAAPKWSSSTRGESWTGARPKCYDQLLLSSGRLLRYFIYYRASVI